MQLYHIRLFKTIYKHRPIGKRRGYIAFIDVSNAGDYDGYEIVQLYINDPVARIARPVKELKSYKRVFIPKGETVNVSFEIDSDMLKYYDNELKYGYDSGEFRVMVGPDSKDLQSLIFYAE